MSLRTNFPWAAICRNKKSFFLSLWLSFELCVAESALTNEISRRNYAAQENSTILITFPQRIAPFYSTHTLPFAHWIMWHLKKQKKNFSFWNIFFSSFFIMFEDMQKVTFARFVLLPKLLFDNLSLIKFPNVWLYFSKNFSILIPLWFV